MPSRHAAACMADDLRRLGGCAMGRGAGRRPSGNPGSWADCPLGWEIAPLGGANGHASVLSWGGRTLAGLDSVVARSQRPQ